MSDSVVAQRKIAEVVDRLGIGHKHALNGMEAWSRLQGIASHIQQTGRSMYEKVHLILVDAEIPGMDGYVLTRNVKADPRFSGVPVAIYSSMSSAANRAMGLSLGLDAYVAKFDA